MPAIHPSRSRERTLTIVEAELIGALTSGCINMHDSN